MAKTNSKEQDQGNTRIAQHVNAVVALVMGLGCIAYLVFLLIWGPTEGGANGQTFARATLPLIMSIAGGGYAIYIRLSMRIDTSANELRLEIRTINEKSESRIEAHRVATEASLASQRKENRDSLESQRKENQASLESQRKENRDSLESQRKENQASIEAHRIATEASIEAHRKQAEKARDDFQKQLLALTEKHAKLEGRVMASN